MIFMCLMNYSDEHDRIIAVRAHHQSYLTRLVDERKIISAGSFIPEDDGGLFLYEADSLEEAEGLVNDDPFVREGLIVSWKLREYEVHGINQDLLRVTGAKASPG